MHRITNSIIIGLVACVLTPAIAQAQHSDDIEVGKSAAGRLVVKGDFDEIFELSPIAEGGLIGGWSANEPGLDAIGEDESDEFLSLLGEGRLIALNIVELSPGLVLRDPLNLAELTSQTPLPTNLHWHPLFHVEGPANPGDIYTATLYLSDLSAQPLADSDAFTLTFQIVPEPASLALVAMGGLTLLRRRRC